MPTTADLEDGGARGGLYVRIVAAPATARRRSVHNVHNVPQPGAAGDSPPQRRAHREGTTSEGKRKAGAEQLSSQLEAPPSGECPATAQGTPSPLQGQA